MRAGTLSAPTRVANVCSRCRYTGVQHSPASRPVIAHVDTLSLDQLREAAPRLMEDVAGTSAALPADLPRREHHHVPESTACSYGGRSLRVGETSPRNWTACPGLHGRAPNPRHVVRHQSQNPDAAPLPAHIIDKGIPNSGLLTQVPVATYHDHLPLHREEHNQGGGVRLRCQPRRSMCAAPCAWKQTAARTTGTARLGRSGQ